MSDVVMEWHRCQWCGVKRFCSDAIWFEHTEDCPRRPARVRRMRLCPKCGDPLDKLMSADRVTWMCPNKKCDFELAGIDGGKLA